MPDTAIPSVWDALTDLIRHGGVPPVNQKGEPLLAFRRVYRGRTGPPGAPDAPLGYFMLGKPLGEEEGEFYGEPGQDGVYRVHCWSDSPDNALKLYRWFKRLVHGERPEMADHALWQDLTVRYRDLVPDPDGTAWQVDCAVTSQTAEMAA